MIYISTLICASIMLSIDSGTALIENRREVSDFGVCREGYFQCVNSTSCISQTQNCDGNVDCEDASDELECADEEGSKYWDHLFRKTPSAEYEEFDEQCVLPYNGSCVCRGKVILCQHKHMKTIPDDLPHKIDLLDFSGNDFRILSKSFLRNLPKGLKTLVLRQCAITRLQPKTFHAHMVLKHLYLDNNEIEKLPENVFPKGNNLIALIASRNRIVNIDRRAFANLEKLIELDLSYNEISKVHPEMLRPLVKLEILYLNSNKIETFSAETFLTPSLITLSLADNRLQKLDAGTFSLMPALKNLFLTDNNIQYLSNGTFDGLGQLVSLNLQGNGIKKMELGVFAAVKNLSSLHLKNNDLRSLPKQLLLPLTKLQYIYLNRFEMCLAAMHVRVCEPKGDGISNREHLLDNPVLRTSVWIMGAVGCFGNVIVLLERCIVPTKNVVHSMYIRNLALSDLLMGVYLFAIAGADHHYRGVYLQNEYMWRHSTLCGLCGFLSTLSCESSVLILTLITWDRFVSVTHPLERKQPSPKTAFLILIMLWTIAITIASTPLTSVAESYFGKDYYRTNGVCLSLYIHDPYDKGWEYSAATFIFVNTLALVFICYAYCRMIKEIKTSTVACRSTRRGKDRDKIAQRFGVIVLTDCMCWFPIVVVKLVALLGLSISESLYAWLAVFVLPINSALNPVLYTLTTTMFIKQMRKIFSLHGFYKKRVDIQNSDSAHSSSMLPRENESRRFQLYREMQTSLTTSRIASWKPSTAV